jgi:uncharacterized membrane protein
VNIKELSLSAIFAGLYAALVIIFGFSSFGPVQLRVADCLIPLAALLGWPVVAGVTIGCFIANAFFMIGIIDVAFGPIANLIAATTILLLRKRPFLACVIGSLPIGLIVGGYLWLFFPPPSIFGLTLPVWTSMVISITISTLIAVAVIGYSLLKALSRPGTVGLLESYGLTVYINK